MRRTTDSADRMGRMATTVGADLGRALEDGRLGPANLRGGVLRCRGCDHACACDAFLDAAPDGAAAAPDYCRNAPLFADLARPG